MLTTYSIIFIVRKIAIVNKENMPTLLPYQRKGADFLKSGKIRYLGDVMGLGKSGQAIIAAQELVDTKKVKDSVLIICPAILQLNWEEEIEKWNGTFNYTISSYASLHKVTVKQYGIVILDEAHYVKNTQAKRTKLSFMLAGKAHRSWFLSGTPMPRCAIDIYPFAKFSGVYPYRFPMFASTYAKEKLIKLPHGRGRLTKIYYGAKNEEQLAELLKPYMLRRFKKDVLRELPEKIRNTVYIDSEETSKYSEHAEIIKTVLTTQKYHTLNPHKKRPVATLRKEIGLDKIVPATTYLNYLWESDPEKPIIVFAHHRQVIDTLTSTLEATGAQVGAIKGGQSKHERKAIFDDFRGGKLRYLILSLEAASVGLTLTESSKVVFLELPWNPATIEQAIGRVDRIGQKDVVNIYFLMLKNSFDDIVRRIILSKRSFERDIIGSE